MKQNNYDFISKMFVSTRNIKLELTRPFTKDGHTYATDGFRAIKIRQDLMGMEYDAMNGVPDVEKLMAKAVEDEGELYTFKISEMLGMLAAHDIRVETIGIDMECKTCEGTGQEECFECGHWSDCEVCDGTGGEKKNRGRIKVKVAVTQNNKDYEFNAIEIEGMKFNAEYWGSAVMALAFAGFDEMTVKFVRQNDTHGMAVFMMEGVQILVMSLHN